MSVVSSSDRKLVADVAVDAVRKLVRIHFRGIVTAAILRGHVDAIRASIAETGPGFSLVTDLSELQEMEIDSVRELTRVMDVCLEGGVKQVVRIIPDPSKDIGFHLLSLTHYRGKVPIATCKSAAEAEGLLAPT